VTPLQEYAGANTICMLQSFLRSHRIKGQSLRKVSTKYSLLN